MKKPGVPACAAFDENLTHYKQQIAALFWFNALLIASYGTDNRSHGGWNGCVLADRAKRQKIALATRRCRRKISANELGAKAKQIPISDLRRL